jgi:hypothetical protein
MPPCITGAAFLFLLRKKQLLVFIGDITLHPYFYNLLKNPKNEK